MTCQGNATFGAFGSGKLKIIHIRGIVLNYRRLFQWRYWDAYLILHHSQPVYKTVHATQNSRFSPSIRIQQRCTLVSSGSHDLLGVSLGIQWPPETTSNYIKLPGSRDRLAMGPWLKTSLPSRGCQLFESPGKVVLGWFPNIVSSVAMWAMWGPGVIYLESPIGLSDLDLRCIPISEPHLLIWIYPPFLPWCCITQCITIVVRGCIRTNGGHCSGHDGQPNCTAIPTKGLPHPAQRVACAWCASAAPACGCSPGDRRPAQFWWAWS